MLTYVRITIQKGTYASSFLNIENEKYFTKIKLRYMVNNVLKQKEIE